MNFFKFFGKYIELIMIMILLGSMAVIGSRLMWYHPTYRASIPISMKLDKADKNNNLLDVNQYLSSNAQVYTSLIKGYPFTRELATTMHQSTTKIDNSIKADNGSDSSLLTINVTTNSKAQTKKLSNLIFKNLKTANKKINKNITFTNLNEKLYIQRIYDPGYLYYGILGAGLGFVIATVIALIVEFSAQSRSRRNLHLDTKE